jgi:hypothetical protein
MLYNLVLLKNTAYSNTRMANIPPEVLTEWDQVFSPETMAKYGARWVVYCNCAWCSEEYKFFAVNTYTDIQARIAHIKEIEKTAWFQYAEVFNLLGTSSEEPQMPAFPNPIYQLFIARNNPLTGANHARETEEEETARWALWQESAKRTGASVVLYCDSYWANEDYLGFGLVAFPSVEARQEHAADLMKMKWTQFYSAFTLLGTPRE